MELMPDRHPPVVPYEQIRPTGGTTPDVITLYEEEGIWASRKLHAKETRQEKAQGDQNEP